MSKPLIFVIGPIPPPIHGQSVAVDQILKSELASDFEFFVLNKASLFSRVGDQGKFRIVKIIRDCKLVLDLTINVIRKSPSICYMTMAQSRSGIIRDSLIIDICSKFSPVIIHLHCGAFRSQFEELNQLEKWFVKSSLLQVEKVIVLSDRFRSMFDNLVPPSKLSIVQNGLPDLDNSNRFTTRINKPPINILFLSNLQPEKGLWDFLELLGCLKSREIPFNAVIAGPFPDESIKNRAFRIIDQLNLINNVELPGVVTGPTKAAYLAKADVFVFIPNQIEGQPLVIIEALMTGLPIIATPQGSIEDMVVDEENGFIVPVHDIEGVVAEIDKLIKDPLLRIEMGKNSRQKYLREYTGGKYLHNIRSIFEDVLAKRRFAKPGKSRRIEWLIPYTVLENAMMKNRILKLIQILQNKVYLQYWLKYGVAAGVEHSSVLGNLKTRNFRTIVDIGANRGQFALIARKCFPEAKIISFEPLKEPALIFQNIFGTDPLVLLHEIALGAKDEDTTIHVSRADDSSSLLPITSLQTTLFPGTHEKETRTIHLKPLEAVLGAKDIERPALLKLDIQGFERQALEGCGSLLRGFSFIYVECSFQELYTGQSLAHEVISFLHDYGFVLTGIYNLSYDKRGSVVQGDFLFSQA